MPVSSPTVVSLPAKTMIERKPYPYEDLILRSPQPLQSAAAMLAEGMARDAHAVLPLQPPVHWENDQQRGRSFLFYLHAWDPLEDLYWAYDQTADPAYLLPLVRIAEDWIDQCNGLDWRAGVQADRAQPGGEGFSWYDMAVALRMFRLAYLYDVLRANAEDVAASTLPAGDPLVDKSLLDKFLASLVQHAKYLSQEEFFQAHNNHGLYQAFAQLAAGRRLAGMQQPVFDTLSAQGKQRVLALVERQFSREGIHLEHSPGYHEMVTQILVATHKSGLLTDDGLRARLQDCIRNIGWFVTPDNRLVNFGDTHQQPPTRDYLGDARLQEVLRTTSKAFPLSGYWFLRSRQPSGDTYLALNAAFHSRTHKHADDSSFVWYDRSVPILIDSGSYAYRGKLGPQDPLRKEGFWYSDPFRIYVERTRAHNTVEIDGRDLPRTNTKPYGSGLNSSGATSIQGSPGSKVYFCDTGIASLARHPKRIRHGRVVVLHPGEWLLCIDILRGNLPFNAKQWYNFHSDINLASLQCGQLDCTLGTSGERIVVYSLVDGVAPCDLGRGWKGVADGPYPGLLGWNSTAPNAIEPNLSVSIGNEKEQREAWNFATLFSFEPVIPQPESTNINASGRRGRFRWRRRDGTRMGVFYNREDPANTAVEVELRGKRTQLL